MADDHPLDALAKFIAQHKDCAAAVSVEVLHPGGHLPAAGHVPYAMSAINGAQSIAMTAWCPSCDAAICRRLDVADVPRATVEQTLGELMASYPAQVTRERRASVIVH